MSSGSLSAATRETGGGGAFRPGPRTAFAMGILVAIVVAATLEVALRSGGGHRPLTQARVHRYGDLPSWLPKISNGTPRLEVARASSPILQEEQGYTVRAELRHGVTNVTAAGPEIPSWVASAEQTGKLSDDDSVPGTFVVTLIGATGHGPDNGRVVHDPHRRWQDRPPEGDPRGRRTRAGRAACGAAREPRRPCSCQRGLRLDPLGTARTQSARRLDLSGRAGLSI